MTCRFVDDVEMDVAAAYVPSQAYEFLPSYISISSLLRYVHYA
jgi:hypothetical protein